MDYRIAIPTYKRALSVGLHTLRYLESTDISRERVTLFVATQEEAAEYRAANPGYGVVVGKPGLQAQRQFIARHYASGTPVLSMDDDVQSVSELVLKKRIYTTTKPMEHPCQLATVTRLDAFIQEGFRMAERYGTGLWGCYQVANAGFMHPRVVVGLKFIMGHFFGFRAGDPVFDELLDYPCKDDFFWSLWHYSNRGGTLRYDYCCVESRAHVNAGGTNGDMERKLQTNNRTVDHIVRKFPGLASVKMRNTKDAWLSRYKEIRLKNATRELVPAYDRLNAAVQ